LANRWFHRSQWRAAYLTIAVVVAVDLWGGLDGGTAGMVTVKEFGGIAIAQDPAEAVFDSMPGFVSDFEFRISSFPRKRGLCPWIPNLKKLTPTWPAPPTACGEPWTIPGE
jgi:hypothetical protein